MNIVVWEGEKIVVEQAVEKRGGFSWKNGNMICKSISLIFPDIYGETEIQRFLVEGVYIKEKRSMIVNKFKV